jgi:hypothetical protein
VSGVVKDTGGIGWVPNKSRVEAWILEGRGDSKGMKDSIDLQTIKGPLQEPVLVGFNVGSLLWRGDNSDFILRENTLTESVCAVTLTKGATLLISKADKEAEAVLAKDGSKSIALAPNSILVTPKNHNARFST